MEADLRPEFLLFGEAPGRVLVSSTTPDRIQQIAEEHRVPALAIGNTTQGRLEIRNNGETLISTTVDHLKAAWSTAFEHHLEKHAALVTTTGDESCGS